MAADAPHAIDVDMNALIDGAPLSPLQFRILFLCLVAMILEGYNTYAVSYVGPQLALAWHIAPSALAVVFTAGIIGSAIGYVAIGPVADRIGRRVPVIAGVVGFGVATLVSATAGSANAFIFYRVIAGLALGVTLPNVISLVAEFAPTRWRGFSVVILYSGFAIGASTGGMIAARLVPTMGWPSIFIVGGGASLALAAAMLALLPESIRFLALKRPDDPRLPGLLKRVAPAASAPSGVRFVLSRERSSRQPVADLFRDGRAPSTLMIWVVLAMDGAALDSLVLWLPTLADRAGVAGQAAIQFTVILLLGGIFGAYLVGFCMDRFGAYRVLVPVELAAAAGVVALGFTLAAPSLGLAVLIGVCLAGGTPGAQGLLARLYPTAVRATGVGWAAGVGRAVGIVAPLAVGGLLTLGLAPDVIVALCGVPILLAALALLGLSRDAYGRAAAGNATPAAMFPLSANSSEL
jgi:AAHS family 4-hydroxybenzoate transporter-like MFS transporter